MKLTLTKGSAEWERALHWVAAAAARERGIHPWLCGVLFVDRGPVIQAVATDGRRLHSAAFPRGTVEAFAEVFSPENPAPRPHSVDRRTQRTLELGWLTGGTFPAWERVVPHHAVSISFAYDSDPAHATGAVLGAMSDDGVARLPGINSRYVEDAVGAPMTRVEYDPRRADAAGIVLRATEDVYERWALIMPVRRGGNEDE